MTEWYPYRLKTEKEFLDEYGNDWRYAVQFNFDGEMDYMCGKVLPFTEDIIKSTVFNGDGFLRFDGWTIKHRMITKNKKREPDYSPRRIIKMIDEDYE